MGACDGGGYFGRLTLLLEAAKDALYQATAEGRDCIVLHETVIDSGEDPRKLFADTKKDRR